MTSWLAGIANHAEKLLESVDQQAAMSLKRSELGQQLADNDIAPADDADFDFDEPLSITHHSEAKVEDKSNIQSSIEATLEQTSLQTSPSASWSGGARDDGSHATASIDAIDASEEKHEKELVAKHQQLEQSKQGGAGASTLSEPTVYSVAENNTPKTTADGPKNGSDLSAKLMQQMENRSISASEAQLLRNEVRSLNEEISLPVKRNKSMQQAYEKAKLQTAAADKLVASKELQLREQMAQQDSLLAQINSNEQQRAKLEAKLEEATALLGVREAAIDELKQEIDRFRKDQATVAGVQTNAFDQVRAKLLETEILLQQESQNAASLKNQLERQRLQMEEEKSEASRLLSVAQRELAEIKQSASEWKQVSQSTRADLESIRQEFVDYKVKATRVLQSKEKMIADLTNEISGVVGSKSNGHANVSAQAEAARLQMIQLQGERTNLLEELNEAKMQIERLKGQIQDMEYQHQAALEMEMEQIKELEATLREEKSNFDTLTLNFQARIEDLDISRSEIVKQKMTLQSQLLDRESEIERLRLQLATKSNNSVQQSELENRLRTLTENLIRKQTDIESLSAEKNSLTLQLETERQRHAKESQEVRIQLERFSDVERQDQTRIRTVASVLPESKSIRKFSQAVGVLDKFSIRLGKFLRLYPIFRVFVICYIILLHLWVMVVLLTYSPETHNMDPTP